MLYSVVAERRFSIARIFDAQPSVGHVLRIPHTELIIIIVGVIHLSSYLTLKGECQIEVAILQRIRHTPDKVRIRIAERHTVVVVNHIITVRIGYT